MAVEFSAVDISFQLEDMLEYEEWLSDVIEEEAYELGELSYVFCSDDYLLEMNIEHLDHDYLTDIITFDYVVDDLLSADMFISIDRVQDNALTFEVTFDNELARVLVHGLLHLMGYDDISDELKMEMRERENYYLKKLFKL